MKTIRTLFLVVLGIIVLIIGLIFSLANMMPVTLKFYHYETISMPLWFLVMISVLSGAFLTVILIFLDLYRGARKISKMKKELRGLERNLSALKQENLLLENDRNNLKKEMHGKTNSEKPRSVKKDTDNAVEVQSED